MNKFMVMVTMLAVGVGVVLAADLTEVSSFAVPQLVSEINTTIGEADTRLDAVEATGVGGTLAAAKIIVGNAGGTAAAVVVSGDIGINTNGAVSITSGAVVNADINAAAAIAHTKLAPVEPGYVMVGNATSQAVAVAVSGDASISTAGVVSTVGLSTNYIVFDGTNYFTLTFTNGQLRIKQ